MVKGDPFMEKGDGFKVIFSIYGVYELDTEGKVLDADILDDKRAVNRTLAVGSSFLEIVGHFANANELHRRFSDFISGSLTTESFLFNAEVCAASTPLKIMFTRTWERSFPSYYFYIRPEG